jgi:hypothetical protein
MALSRSVPNIGPRRSLDPGRPRGRPAGGHADHRQTPRRRRRARRQRHLRAPPPLARQLPHPRRTLTLTGRSRPQSAASTEVEKNPTKGFGGSDHIRHRLAALLRQSGKSAIRWTRLRSHAFRHDAVRLQLHALAHGPPRASRGLPDAANRRMIGGRKLAKGESRHKGDWPVIGGRMLHRDHLCGREPPFSCSSSQRMSCWLTRSAFSNCGKCEAFSTICRESVARNRLTLICSHAMSGMH